MELKRLLDLGKITTLDLKIDDIKKLEVVYDKEIKSKMAKFKKLKI